MMSILWSILPLFLQDNKSQSHIHDFVNISDPPDNEGLNELQNEVVQIPHRKSTMLSKYKDFLINMPNLTRKDESSSSHP